MESCDLNCLFVQSEQLSDLHCSKCFSPNTMQALINFIVNLLLCPTTFMCKLIVVIKNCDDKVAHPERTHPNAVVLVSEVDIGVN